MTHHTIRTRQDALDVLIQTPGGTVTVGQLIDSIMDLVDGNGLHTPEDVQRETGCCIADCTRIVESLQTVDSLWSIRS